MQDTDDWLPPLRAGRQAAGRALLSWLDDTRAPRLCRVSGAPGSGKTELVAWLATVCTSPGGRAGRQAAAVLSAAGLSLDGAVWRLALRLGVAARTAAELLAELAADDRPLLLAFWDLDRAAEPERIAAELLDPLLALPQVRAVLEAVTRPAAAGPEAVLDLDESEWTDPERFARWYRRLAAGSPFTAQEVYPNPRLARLAALVPAGTDPSAGVAAAWWSAVPAGLRPAFRALAAADRPLGAEEWALLTEPDAARRAGELLPPDSPAGDTWWLPAGPLREAVTAGAPEPDHDALVRALGAGVPRAADGGLDLTKSDPDLLGLILRHSVRSGSAAALLEDPRYLAHADPVAVTAAFAAHPGSRLAGAWRAAGPALLDEPDPLVRSALLHSRLLGHDPAAATALGDPGGPGWRADWAVWVPEAQPPLLAAALSSSQYGGHVLFVDAAGALRAAELTTGQVSEVPAHPAPAQLRSLAALPDGTVAALDASGHPQLLLGAALPVLPRFADAELSALSPLPAVGDTAGRVHWLPEGAAEQLHSGPVTALDATVLAATGEPLLLSGDLDGRVRFWKPGSEPLPQPVDRRDNPVVAVAVADGPQGVVLASAWADGTVRIRCLRDAEAITDLRPGSPVRSVLVDSGGRVVLLLPDGVLALTLGSRPRLGRDVPTGGGGYFSAAAPFTTRPAGAGGAEPPPAGPPLTDALRAAARRRPGTWLYAVDPGFDPRQEVPAHGVAGAWQVGQQGAVVRFVPNPAHRPAG
ncbi:hypothetical protein GCM10009760_60250 [Kitasatospora kazusensis]|uniref:WD40 repeat protein n=1 Tax=Kitasatospora kazusensis TaxID=407974 RepID=A0ABN3ABA1_9ACTN